MDNELLYLIGEAAITEIENVKDVFYSKKQSNVCILVMNDGTRYELMLTPLNEKA